MRTISNIEMENVSGGLLPQAIRNVLINEGIYAVGRYIYELKALVLTRIENGSRLVVCPNIMGDPDFWACEP